MGYLMIYLVGAYLDGALYSVKLGSSDDPEKRLLELRTACPLPLRLLATIRGSTEREKALHALLDRWRMSGEWFYPSSDVAAVFGVSLSDLRVATESDSVAALRARVAELEARPPKVIEPAPFSRLFQIGQDLETAVERFRRGYVLSAVETMGGNRSAAARALNCAVRTVFRYTASASSNSTAEA